MSNGSKQIVPLVIHTNFHKIASSKNIVNKHREAILRELNQKPIKMTNKSCVAIHLFPVCTLIPSEEICIQLRQTIHQLNIKNDLEK